MDFTDEEKQWLLTMSSEIPDCDELSLVEQQLSEMAEPISLFEALMFQISASIQFERNSPYIPASVDIEPGTKPCHKGTTVSSQCG